MLDLLWSVSPLAVVLVLMLGLRWGGSKAGPVGLVGAVLVATVVFGAGLDVMIVAFGRSFFLALYVLYIIWMALFLYHTVNEAGAIDVIGQELPKLATNRTTQVLLLAWVFGSFLQGASGFGVPAAVVAPLLVGLGFAPTVAVVTALAGHGWAVTFGSLGTSFSALVVTSGLDGALLAQPAALMLWVGCFMCGAFCLWTTGKLAAIRQEMPRLLLLTLVMGGTQLLLARFEFWSIASFGGGLAGLVVLLADLRFGLLGGQRAGGMPSFNSQRLGYAMAPYMLLIVVVLLGQFPLKQPLGWLMLNLNFPEVTTARGWSMAAGAGRSINVFGHAGALLLYTSLLAYVLFRWRGVPRERGGYDFGRIVQKTISGSKKTTISVLTLLAMAVVMEHAGMTNILAQAISGAAGGLFPLLSPFIGALGAFMTGSNTNSNVVFTPLQLQTARALDLHVPLILAAQTAGGAIGSIFAPAKVIVGCSTVEGTNDADVLRSITVYGLVMVAVFGVIAIVAVSLL